MKHVLSKPRRELCWRLQCQKAPTPATGCCHGPGVLASECKCNVVLLRFSLISQVDTHCPTYLRGWCPKKGNAQPDGCLHIPKEKIHRRKGIFGGSRVVWLNMACQPSRSWRISANWEHRHGFGVRGVLWRIKHQCVWGLCLLCVDSLWERTTGLTVRNTEKNTAAVLGWGGC